MEASFNQAHILGDSPDVADVSFRMTPNFFTNGVFHESFLTTNSTGNNSAKGFNDFNVGMREAFVEMKNVIKSAPEVTFWAGQRFYDRYNTDPADWFWLDTSGFGIGAYNIHVGPGNLYLAWIGANHDSLNLVNTPDQQNFVGDQFEQTIDIRYKDIDIGFGKLSFVGIGNYIKGANNITGSNGSTTTFTPIAVPGGPTTATVNVATSDAYGAGGGVIWQYDFGNKSYLRIFGLAGYGVTNFSAENLGNAVPAFENNVNNFLVHGPGAATNVHNTAPGVFSGSVNPYRNSYLFRAGYEFVWNVTNCFAFDFWGDWDHQVQGFQLLGTNGSGAISTANATRNWYGVAVRPVWWISDNIALQGQAGFQYVDNVRGYSGTNAFGNSGEFGIFTIAPTIKPKGGYFTRPELRLFATYSIWSNSLKGTTTPTGEGGNLSGSNPPYNGNTNQGWLLGSQLEIWF
jgi:maltoporin